MARGRSRGRLNFDRVLMEIGEDAIKAAKQELEKGADKIAADARSLVRIGPGGKGHHPGMLRNAIKWKWKGKRIIISATEAQNPKGIPYGQYVEFWRKHAFMYPAMRANRQEIKEAVIEAIRRSVRSHAKS